MELYLIWRRWTTRSIFPASHVTPLGGLSPWRQRRASSAGLPDWARFPAPNLAISCQIEAGKSNPIWQPCLAKETETAGFGRSGGNFSAIPIYYRKKWQICWFITFLFGILVYLEGVFSVFRRCILCILCVLSRPESTWGGGRMLGCGWGDR